MKRGNKMTKIIEITFADKETEDVVVGTEDVKYSEGSNTKSTTFIHLNSQVDRLLLKELLPSLKPFEDSSTFQPYVDWTKEEDQVSQIKELIEKDNTTFIFVDYDKDKDMLYYEETGIEILQELYNETTQEDQEIKDLLNKLNLEEQVEFLHILKDMAIVESLIEAEKAKEQ